MLLSHSIPFVNLSPVHSVARSEVLLLCLFAAAAVARRCTAMAVQAQGQWQQAGIPDYQTMCADKFFLRIIRIPWCAQLQPSTAEFLLQHARASLRTACPPSVLRSRAARA